jgi:hypothetical protein
MAGDKDIEKLKKKIRRLEIPRNLNMRWSRTQRFYVAPRHRCIFDVEANPKSWDMTIDQKVEMANLYRNGKPGDSPITKTEYEQFLIWLEKHPNVMKATSIHWINLYQDMKIKEHIMEASKKALLDPTPQGFIALHRYIDSYNKATAEILGLKYKLKRQTRNKIPSPIEVNPAEKKAIEEKYKDRAKDE